MHKENHIICLNYPIFCGSLEQLPKGSQLVVNTINQYSYCIAEKDTEFKEALTKGTVLLPDGIGIVFASKWIHRIKIRKIAGADLHVFLLKKLNREKGSCFYMGSSNHTLSKIRERVALEYPNIKLEVYSPPFKATFSERENSEIIEAVNSFKPDVLFVGMTAPKQEKWSYINRGGLNAGMICSIGAVFDFYAGTTKRPHKIWIALGLEWFGRLLKEPGRMWKRYIFYGIIFISYLIRAKFDTIKKQ